MLIDRLRRLARTGVTPDLSPREAKHVTIVNVIVLFVAVAGTNWTLLGLVMREPYLFWLGIVQPPIFLPALWLNAKGRPLAAALYTQFVSNVLLVTLAFVFGKGMSAHLFLLLGAMFPFLSLPRRHLRYAFGASVFASVSFVATTILLDRFPPPVRVAHQELLERANLVVLALLGVLVGFHAASGIADAEESLEHERVRSEGLLLNILPVAIAERLKSGESAIADEVHEASVLFSDIVGFTPLSGRLKPDQLVKVLDEVFSAFDDLCAKHGLEKIKTIGDAYMVAAGIPEAREDHALAIAAMAVDMRRVVKELPIAREHGLDIRIGAHAGPVVAGVIGKSKFAYDLWGDTVNTAARMESHGVPGEVHVSERVALAVGDRFALEPRGEIEVKGEGLMRTFLLRPLA